MKTLSKPVTYRKVTQAAAYGGIARELHRIVYENGMEVQAERLSVSAYYIAAPR